MICWSRNQNWIADICGLICWLILLSFISLSAICYLHTALSISRRCSQRYFWALSWCDRNHQTDTQCKRVESFRIVSSLGTLSGERENKSDWLVDSIMVVGCCRRHRRRRGWSQLCVCGCSKCRRGKWTLTTKLPTCCFVVVVVVATCCLQSVVQRERQLNSDDNFSSLTDRKRVMSFFVSPSGWSTTTSTSASLAANKAEQVEAHQVVIIGKLSEAEEEEQRDEADKLLLLRTLTCWQFIASASRFWPHQSRQPINVLSVQQPKVRPAKS